MSEITYHTFSNNLHEPEGENEFNKLHIMMSFLILT